MSEYSKERTFVLVGTLEDEGYLFKAEYGGLLSEAILKERIMQQYAKATSHFTTTKGTQRIRITMEISEVEP